MRGKSLALLSMALGCGLVASVGITQVMSRRNTEPAANDGNVQAVFVATQDIDPGTPLTAQALRLEQWPKDKVPTGALAKIEDVEGRRTRTKLFEGMPILDNALLTKGTTGGGATSMIPKGYRVVPVKVDSVSGGSSMIQPGDRVDVMIFVTADPLTGVTRSGIRTVLQDVKVFAVNADFGYESTETPMASISAKTISLLVTPDQANKLMLAAELGKVRLVMRSPEDNEAVETRNVSSVDLFGGPEAEDQADVTEAADARVKQDKGGSFLNFLQRAAVGTQQPATFPQQQQQRAQHTVRILSGSDVSDVMLEASEDSDRMTSSFNKWRVTSRDSVPSFGGRPERTPEPVAASPSEKQSSPEEGESGEEEERQPTEAEEDDS